MSAIAGSPQKSSPSETKPKRGLLRRMMRLMGWLVLMVVLAVVVARPFLPKAVLWYVNRALNQSLLYQGKVGSIDLHLWRGAYSIRDVRILKSTGDVPVPLFYADRVDLALQWSAILKRKVVGQVTIYNPQINFVDDPGAGNGETGAGGPWLKIISDLFPFDINSAQVVDGSVHFRTYQKATPVDVYLSQIHADVDDLTNVDRSITPLLTTVNVTAMAMGQAKFEMHIKLNPFSYNPTFHLDLRLLGLDITKTNDLIETYGGFNVKRGLFDLVVDIDSDEGMLSGYAKPLFRNMIIFDPVKDLAGGDALHAFWQAIVGASAAILTNYHRDQLGTLIPFTGEIKGPRIEFLATIGNVLRNAFIRAYLPRLEQGNQPDDGLQFGPATLTDPISAGD